MVSDKLARAVRHSPSTAVVSRVSVTRRVFRGGRNGIWVAFLGVSPVFPYHKFHFTISSHSFHLFRFISLWWCVRRCQLESLLFTDLQIKGLHRISSLDTALCRTRVEDSFYLFVGNIAALFSVLFNKLWTQTLLKF